MWQWTKIVNIFSFSTKEEKRLKIIVYDLYKLVFLLRQKMNLPHITLFLTSYDIFAEYFVTAIALFSIFPDLIFPPKLFVYFFNGEIFTHNRIIPF